MTLAQRFSIKRPGKADLRPFPSRLRPQFAKSFQVIALHLRSHTTRLNCAKVARPIWVALFALCIAGCQSNADRDLIARDRRMQEDQMWAMQDYLQQYQQLICRFRSENASLRRQLNDERSGTVVEREPQPATRPQPNWPATGGGPPIQTTPAPGTEKKQVPSPNIEMPDVPPLKQGTSNNSSHRYQSLANHEGGQTESDRYAQLASYEAKVDGAAATSAGDPVAPDASNNLRQNDSTIRDAAATASPDILLTGEVVANDSDGGPRLVIDIEAFDQSGSIARFDGNVSLALLSSEGGVQHRLARWNFGPDEVRSAVDATASEPTMRFRVELPVGTKVEGATELWVRLSPAAGGRLLSVMRLFASVSPAGTVTVRGDDACVSCPLASR